MKNLILVIGRSGCGKTNFGLGLRALVPNSKFLDVGELLREKAKTDPQIEKILSQGRKVSSEKIREILHDAFEMSTEKNIILASMPRSKEDAEVVISLYHFFKKMYVVYLDVPERECTERLLGRNDNTRTDDKTIIQIRNRMLQLPDTLKGIHYLEEHEANIITVPYVKDNMILDNVLSVLPQLGESIVRYVPYVRLSGYKIFSGPSCAGKNTAKKYLLNDLGMSAFFKEPVSATTRTRGENEVDGKDYYFLTEENFKQKIANNEFVEWQEVYKGRFYGVLKSEVERVHRFGKYCLFDIDVKGAETIKKLYPETICVGIIPNSIQSLRERIVEREKKEKRNISHQEMQERMDKVAKEISFIFQNHQIFDRNIVNGNLGQFFKKLKNYLFATNVANLVK